MLRLYSFREKNSLVFFSAWLCSAPLRLEGGFASGRGEEGCWSMSGCVRGDAGRFSTPGPKRASSRRGAEKRHAEGGDDFGNLL